MPQNQRGQVMPKWLDTLKELWTTPSEDMSALMAEQEKVAMLQRALELQEEKDIQALHDAMSKFTMFQTAIKDGKVVSQDTRQQKTQEQINQEFKAIKEGGIITLKPVGIEESDKYKKIKESVMSNETDAQEYESRYTSLNLKAYPEDGRNISFMRVIKLGTREVLFPKNMVNPGITDSKFKQFILMQKNIASSERLQVVEWGKDFQALFFDRKPEYLQLAGMLKNTIDCPWTMNMIFAWDEYFRGTRLVEQGAICQLYIDGEIYEGYPFNFSRSKVAPNDFMVTFSMSFLIRERIQIYE